MQLLKYQHLGPPGRTFKYMELTLNTWNPNAMFES